jgi:O-antigen/teichoic acid export membrane protein
MRVDAVKTIFAARRVLQLHAFDLSSEEGRAAERYRLAFLSIIANVASKSLSMIVMVLSVGWTLPYLGQERFGVWMTIASFVGMLLFLDLGIGNALTNHVAQSAVKGDAETLSQTISGGLGFLFVVGLCASLSLSALVAVLPWEKIIKVKNPQIQIETLHAIFLFSVLFGLNLFGTGVQKVFSGLQRSFEAHSVSALLSVFSLGLLWWASREQAHIPTLLLATLGCQSLGGIILTGMLFKRSYFQFDGIVGLIAREKSILLRIGGLYFVLQIGTMVGWGADNLIISSTLGAAYVAIYSLTQRLFQFVSIPLAMINAPLWSAYADATARGDRQFIRKTFKKSLVVTAFLAVVSGLVLVVLSSQLIQWWTKGIVEIPTSFVLVFFIWTVCEAIGNSLAMMLNGCGIVKEQVIAVLTLTAVALPFKIIFVDRFGLTGMLSIYLFLYVSSIAFFYGFLFRKSISRKMDFA